MPRLIYPAILLAVASIGSAPQQGVDPPTLSARTDLVTLPVSVVDPRGAVVAGLRQEHFTVYDNGQRQTIQFFTSEDLPATIGLIVDSSGSMRNRRGEITAVADAFAGMGREADEFFTLSFNDAVWSGLPPSLVFTTEPDALRAAVLIAPAQGMTALYDALIHGLGHLQQGTRDRKALIVISDGGDNASTNALAAVVDRARRTDAVIYCVTLVDSDNRDARPQVLKSLARETGGRVFKAEGHEDVARSFERIAQEIRSGYMIGFSPAETATEGGFRSIRVVVEAAGHRQLIARTRAGYYAGRSRETAR